MSITDTDSTRLYLAASRAFTPAAPINGLDLFAGRKKQIRQAIDAINQVGQHAIIYGERGVGKTSISNVLKDFLGETNISFPILAPRVTCDSGDSYFTVWMKVFQAIREMGTDRGVNLPGCPIFDIIDAEPDDAIDEITPDLVRRSLAAVAEPIILIVIIDEFDRITNSLLKGLFSDTIKVISDHAVDATIILVGVADSVDDLIEEHQSVERALVQVPMPRMSEEETFEIIENGLSRLDNMKIARDAKQMIAIISKGLPFYAHLLGLHSARCAISRKESNVTEIDVLDALDGALEGAGQSIYTAYRKAVASRRRNSLFPLVLLACAMALTDEHGYFRFADVREPYENIRGKGKKYSVPYFTKQIAQFCEEQRGPILEKTLFDYRFINPLMQPYILMDGYNKGLIGAPKPN